MTTATDIRVEIRRFPDVRMAALQHRGAYRKAGPVFDRLAAIIAERGLGAGVTASGMVGYHNPSVTREEDLRAHVCALVTEEFRIFPPLEELRYPAGRYAVLVHRGPYSGLARSYRALIEDWLPEAGEEALARAPYEVYLNSPEQVAPEDLRTEIRVPLKG